jgi:hypothetical protein
LLLAGMVMVPRRAPSALIATATWVDLWVSTPMMTSVLGSVLGRISFMM